MATAEVPRCRVCQSLDGADGVPFKEVDLCALCADALATEAKKKIPESEIPF